jgi:acetyltransferase-like isoleucine patch superfamily enzyme
MELQHIDNHHYLHTTAMLCHPNNVEQAEGSRINEYVLVRSPESKLTLGKNSHIGPFSVLFTGTYGITIGEDVMIAPHCCFAEGSHEYRNPDVPMQWAGNFSNGPIIIEDDVWIGANCTILHNVRIGKGSVIGANSLVNKDVEPYSIMGGAPARKIKSRLDYKK